MGYVVRALSTIALTLAVAASAAAQPFPRKPGTISAAGSDCSVATRCVALDVGAGADSAAVVVRGSWSGMPIVEISVDGTEPWTAQPEGFNIATGALLIAGVIPGNGYYVVPLRGAQKVRVRASALSSGTIDVVIASAPASGGVAITQPLSVTVSSTALPAGAATAARQDTGNASLSTLAGAVAGSEMQVDVVTSALPSGAATAANQSTANASLASIDGKIPSSPATDRATAGAPFSVRLSNGSSFLTPTTPSDTQPVSAASLPLPTGAATEATLSTLSGKVPSSAALADNTANPTTTSLGMFAHIFDGSTWDRWTGAVSQ
jgi:hypothetical protein